MQGEHNLLFGLTNDALGYILTKVDWGSFKRCDYVSRTSLGEMTGERYIEEALKLVAACPAPDSTQVILRTMRMARGRGDDDFPQQDFATYVTKLLLPGARCALHLREKRSSYRRPYEQLLVASDRDCGSSSFISRVRVGRECGAGCARGTDSAGAGRRRCAGGISEHVCDRGERDRARERYRIQWQRRDRRLRRAGANPLDGDEV
jgi:hypothetical protein